MRIPTNKHDVDAVKSLVTAGYPAVEPLLPKILRWLQDGNWPVARALAPFLQSIGDPLVPHVREVLLTDDDLWKYWCLATLGESFTLEGLQSLRPELEVLVDAPAPRGSDVPEEARLLLDRLAQMESSEDVRSE